MSTEAATRIDHEAVEGLVELRNAVPSQLCSALVNEAERRGFDNATHPKYQSKQIDVREAVFRRNDRCVLEAPSDALEAVWSTVKPHVPATIDYGDYGHWHAHGLNEMWRFYRYRFDDDDDDDDEASVQRFPIHFDNTTVKTTRYVSWLTVLVYLSDGFGGGGTAFYKTNHQRQLDENSGAVAEVTPATGTVALFFHTGHLSPMHAGRPLTRVAGTEQPPKYVLRTDVMYEAEAEPHIPMKLSCPYDESPPTFTSLFARAA